MSSVAPSSPSDGSLQRLSKGALECAAEEVRQSLAGAGSSEGPAALASRLRGPALRSEGLRAILRRHGWTTAVAARIGCFAGTPDRLALLRDLEAFAKYGELSLKFHFSEKIGEGVYGKVYRAVNSSTGQVVAVKRQKFHDAVDEGIPSTAIREISLLKALSHPNIVELLECSCAVGSADLVFEYVSVNLRQHIRRRDGNLDASEVLSFSQQLLMGLEHCHASGVIHRDLKPANTLISEEGVLKIADFGLARQISLPMPAYTPTVVTLWYRAPELLLGVERYELGLDMWSAGCIFGEMGTGQALFQGDQTTQNEVGTIFEIFKLLGAPQEDSFLRQLPYFKATFPKFRRKAWGVAWPGLPAKLGAAGLRLLDGMLAFSPRRRVSARHALESRYFRSSAAARPARERSDRSRSPVGRPARRSPPWCALGPRAVGPAPASPEAPASPGAAGSGESSEAQTRKYASSTLSGLSTADRADAGAADAALPAASGAAPRVTLSARAQAVGQSLHAEIASEFQATAAMELIGRFDSQSGANVADDPMTGQGMDSELKCSRCDAPETGMEGRDQLGPTLSANALLELAALPPTPPPRRVGRRKSVSRAEVMARGFLADSTSKKDVVYARREACPHLELQPRAGKTFWYKCRNCPARLPRLHKDELIGPALSAV